jgi:nicotinamide phosphoribosyltransferase
MNNIILHSESSKITHWKQYPPGTENVYSYLEARGPIGSFMPEIVFFGLQYYLKKYLVGQVITEEKIDEAEEISKIHFNNQNFFNREGWEYILNEYDGRLPIKIKALPEGTVIPRWNVLMTIENTDPACYWLTSYLEPLLLQVWYGSTVATLSREYKLLLLDFLDKSSDDISLIDFKLHDMGLRSASSVESASIGGAAHLINFKSTNNLAGLILAKKYYNCEMAGYSIPSSDHATITSWGQENELSAFENMLNLYPTGLVACMSDSYNVHHACTSHWGKQLKAKVLSRNGVIAIQPDSGELRLTIIRILNSLGNSFGFVRNSKGFKLLPPQVRIIQGDGIDLDSIRNIIEGMWREHWSADNIIFGSGTGLLQKVNRDTCKFAFKCSSVKINGIDKEVYKKPYDDAHKSSKRGRLKLLFEKDKWRTVNESASGDDMLNEVFYNGELLSEVYFDEIRDLAFVE